MSQRWPSPAAGSPLSLVKKSVREKGGVNRSRVLERDGWSTIELACGSVWSSRGLKRSPPWTLCLCVERERERDFGLVLPRPSPDFGAVQVARRNGGPVPLPNLLCHWSAGAGGREMFGKHQVVEVTSITSRRSMTRSRTISGTISHGPKTEREGKRDTHYK